MGNEQEKAVGKSNEKGKDRRKGIGKGDENEERAVMKASR